MSDLRAVDYGADLDVGPGDNLLATIDFLANQLLDAEAAVEEAEAALKAANDRVRDLAERQLPEAMVAARQKKLTTASDVEVRVEDKVRASVPEARRGAAIAWLREHDHGALVKTQLAVAFEAGRDPAALGLQQMLVAVSRSEDALARLRVVLVEAVGLTPDMEAALAFLRAAGNEGETRFALEAKVNSQSLAALVRELLRDGKIDQAAMETIGAHAWKQASVARKG